MENPFPDRVNHTDISKLVKVRVCNWLFTAYNLEEQGTRFLSWLENRFNTGEIKEYFWGVEKCPSTQTQHAHGGIRFATKMRFNVLKQVLEDSNLRAWLSPMNGTWKQAQDYAWKERLPDYPTQDYFNPRFVHGTKKTSGDSQNRKQQSFSEELCELILEGRTEEALEQMSATQAVRLAPKIKDALSLTPSRCYMPLVVWLYGPTGTGKSLLGAWLGRNKDIQTHWQGLEENLKFWNGYTQQEAVVLDEARESSLPFQTFLRIANHAPYQVEVKNSSANLTSPLIIVTSPSPPWSFWKETIDEDGHPMDINQIMRRIGLVVKLMASNHPHRTVQTKKKLWESTPTAPSFNPAVSDPRVWSEGFLQSVVEDVGLLHTLLEENSETWKWSPSTETQAPMILTSVQSTVLRLVEERIIRLPGNAHALAELNPQSEEKLHWKKRIRLPKGMAEEDKDEILNDLGRDKLFRVKFVLEWKHLDDMTRVKLYDHYFGRFFENDYVEQDNE